MLHPLHGVHRCLFGSGRALGFHMLISLGSLDFFGGSGRRRMLLMLRLPRKRRKQCAKTFTQTLLSCHDQFSFLLASIACSTVSERRESSSAASQYAIAPMPLGSYAITLWLKLGASEIFTVRGMVVSSTIVG